MLLSSDWESLFKGRIITLRCNYTGWTLCQIDFNEWLLPFWSLWLFVSHEGQYFQNGLLSVSQPVNEFILINGLWVWLDMIWGMLRFAATVECQEKPWSTSLSL